jgi:hypothetical protein
MHSYSQEFQISNHARSVTKRPYDEEWAADLFRQRYVHHDLPRAPINGIVWISS